SYLIRKCYVSFFFTSRRRHTRSKRDWSSDVCSSDLEAKLIWFYFTRHTHRHIRSSMETTSEGDNRLSTCVATSNFHRIFNCFCTRVEKDGLFIKISWCNVTKLFC